MQSNATGTPGSGETVGQVFPPGVTDLIHGLFPTVESQVVATLLAVALLGGAGELVRRLGPRLKDRFDDAAVESIQAATMATLAGLVGAFFVVVWRGSAEVSYVMDALDFQRDDVVRLVFTVALFAAAYALTRVTKHAIKHTGRTRGAITEHQREIGHHVVQVSIYVFALVVILGLWGVNVGGLLVGAGFAGIVLGLAARQTLGSVIAGFVVLFSRPFELGDWIEIDDREGVVTDITIVNTQLRTFDDEVVMVPNDVVTSSEVVNRSRRGRLRIEVDVGVDYGTDLDEAATLAEEAMSEVDLLLEKPDPHVVLTEFADSAVVLRLRFFVDDPSARKMWEARTRVIAGVKERFEEAGVRIPFPQRVLSGRGDGDDLRIATPGGGEESAGTQHGGNVTADGGRDGEVRDDEGRDAGTGDDSDER